MAKCKVCGFRLGDGAESCPMCGAVAGATVPGNAVPNANLQKSFCPACGNKILGEHRYCPACGKELPAMQEQKRTATPVQSGTTAQEPAAAPVEAAEQTHDTQEKTETAQATAADKSTKTIVNVLSLIFAFTGSISLTAYILTALIYTDPNWLNWLVLFLLGFVYVVVGFLLWGVYEGAFKRYRNIIYKLSITLSILSLIYILYVVTSYL
ncbi:MAG: zinc-ribbon domain-containing protein [Treponema sp.]